MKSGKRAQKFHTDDARQDSDLGSASDWMKQIFSQRITEILVVTRHQWYGIFSPSTQTSFHRDTRGGCREMPAVFLD